jgi:hypothetical protein
MSNKEAMIRWQNHARESRTAVNSHFLAYSAGILAFQSSVLTDNDVQKINHAYIYILAGGLAILSLIIGSIVVLIRLRDARLTARVARYKDQGEAQETIEQLREKTNFLGKWTNRLIPLQVTVFSLSAISFIAWVVSSHWDKLAWQL